MTVQNQAVSSSNGQLYTWVTASPDWAASSFPGPGTALHIAVAMAPATAGGGGGGVTDHGALTGLNDDDHAALYALFRRPLQAYTGASNDFALADVRKFVTASHGSNHSLRVRLQSALAWTAADELAGANIGAGSLTITAEAGVTINGSVTVPANGWFWLKRTGSNVWQCFVGGTGSGSSVTAGDGLTDTAGTFSVDPDGGTLSVSVAGVKVSAGGISATELASDAVTTAKILNANVTTAKIADGAVTDAKLASTFLKANGSVPLSATWALGNQSLTGLKVLSYNGEIDNGNSGTSKTIDWSAGALQRCKLTGNVTFTFSNLVAGTDYRLRVTGDGTARTITWPAAVSWLGGVAPVLASANDAPTFLTFFYDDAGTLWGSGGGSTYLSVGSAPATQGSVRLTGDASLITRFPDATERVLAFIHQSSGTLYINSDGGGTLSGITALGNVSIGWSSGNFTLFDATSTRFRITNSLIELGHNRMEFAATIATTCSIGQGAANTTSPRSLTLQPQKSTSTGTITPSWMTVAGADADATTPVGTQAAGHSWFRGGAALGGSGTRNGGNAYASGGHVGGGGGTTVGFFAIMDGSKADVTLQNVRFKANLTGIGFFSATPVAQQADLVALTDSTGGTANNTVQDVTASHDQTILNNNFADLVAKYNGIRTLLRNYGLMA